jgi:hypothetical protein
MLAIAIRAVEEQESTQQPNAARGAGVVIDGADVKNTLLK